MTKFLIITADDFGLHDYVNEAVEQASRLGVLTSASLMVGGPAAADAIRRARSLPALRVGLHVVLVDGMAVLPPAAIPRLADHTGLMNTEMVYKSMRAFALPSMRRQIAAEIRAQFEAFAASGLTLDHVNAHKHFHLHPTLLNMIIRIGRDYGLSAMRVPDEPRGFASGHPARRLSVGHVLLQPWLGLMKRSIDRAGLFHNDALFGIAHSGAMTEATLLRVIEYLPAGVSEVYLHPAVGSRSVTASMAGYRHAEELSALLSLRVRNAIVENGIEIGGFCDAQRLTAPKRPP